MEQVPARSREYELHDECAEVFAQFIQDFITYTAAKMTRSELAAAVPHDEWFGSPSDFNFHIYYLEAS